MRGAWVLGLLALIGCGDSGPSEAELAAAKSEKNCSKVYSAMTKVLKDELHKGGVAGVEFGDKDGFVKLCVGAGFTEEQVKCLDPNLGGSDECKKAMEDKKEKVKELTEYLLKPMKEKSDKPAEGAAEGGE